jgi:HD-GYP domain-containing protein (c-di-GMP phosphodiesterase class II)
MKEKLLATIITLTGGVVLVLSWNGIQWNELSLEQVGVAALLTGSMVMADRYPIHLMRGAKTSLVSIPIYLAVVLLPAHLAVAATGGGILLADLLSRSTRNLTISDILGNTGRWLGISFIGNWAAHLTLPGHIDPMILLFASACTLFLADFLSFSLSLSFIVNEPFIALLKSALKEGGIIEATQYLIGVVGAFAVLQNVLILPLLVIPAVITYTAFKSIKELQLNTKQMLEEFADTVDMRDIYTGGHSKRVTDLVKKILERLSITGPEADLIEIAARLHDIGKIAVPDEILEKAGKLTPEEWQLMQAHSKKGADLLSHYSDFSRGARAILHHHESWDGTGYPGHLKGYDIPFGSRIIAVVDSFDAMTSDRPYRRAMSISQASAILREGRNQQWDPEIVNVLLEILTEEQKESPTVLPLNRKLVTDN